MKKIIAILLVLAMVICFGACNKNEKPVDPGMPNPMTEVASLDELNAAAGCYLIQPGVMGVSDEKFIVIKSGDYNVGEYQFTISGVNYTLRAAATTEDISGVYVDGNTAFPEVKEGIDIVETEEVKLARWFNLNGQHVLSAKGDIDSETFAGVADEICTESGITGGENG